MPYLFKLWDPGSGSFQMSPLQSTLHFVFPLYYCISSSKFKFPKNMKRIHDAAQGVCRGPKKLSSRKNINLAKRKYLQDLKKERKKSYLHT